MPRALQPGVFGIMSEEERKIPDFQELYQRIAAPLVAAAPPKWRELRQTALQVGKSGQRISHAILEDGTRAFISGRSFDASRALREIRAALYQPGKGGWYTARCTVYVGHSISMDFNYDDEPQWDIDIVPATYVEDLEMFPRDLEHQPDWLREKLRQAGAGPRPGG